jgi:hypothetical protein
MVLVYDAAEAPAGVVAWTVIVQVPGFVMLPAGIVPPDKETVRGSVAETVPPQVVVADPATTVKTVPGRVSDIFTPVYAEPDGFWRVMVSVVVPPAWIASGEKTFSIPIACTLRGAEAGEELVTPCWVPIAFAGMVLV